MIYILIILFSQYQKPATPVAVEFNSLEACRAAAAEMRKQAKDYSDGWRIPVTVCAAKGKLSNS